METKPKEEVEEEGGENIVEIKNVKTEINDDCAAKEPSDKDSYLNRDEYTSEHFKLEIKNLPKNFGFGVSQNISRNIEICSCFLY